VKSKRRQASKAAALYTSPLFRGRVAYVERTCDRWYVLTAREGLVHPDAILEPTEGSLTIATPAARRAWAARLVDRIVHELGDVRGHEFEIHAGTPYRDHGLVASLERLGASVDVPTQGLSQGAQLAFYNAARNGHAARDEFSPRESPSPPSPFRTP